MKRGVGIAELKSRLSEYLRAVRRGREVTVLDRATPIARIVPYPREAAGLSVREPAGRVARPGDVELPPPVQLDVDVVEILRQERGER